jgi:Sulfotransferase domain
VTDQPRHLLIIGAQRCGTTYLSSLLDAHPDVAMARPARPEPKVLLSPERAARGLAWYHSTYFSHAAAESLLGEKSTSYLEDPDAPRRAVEMLGRAEIVVVLRDPVTRAVSNWRFSRAHGLEERPLVRALTDNLRGAREWDVARTSVSPYAYLERGRYAAYLEPWFAAFPDSVHVLFLSELAGQRAAVAGLYASLGLDAIPDPGRLDQAVNASDGVVPELDTSLVARLRAYFRDSDVCLRERLGRDLPWPVG